MSRARWTFAVAAAAWLLAAGLAWGQGNEPPRATEASSPAGEDAARRPVRFYQVLVPQAELERAIGGLLPIKRSRFEEFAQRIADSKIERPDRLRTVRVDLTAVWEDDRLLSGGGAVLFAGDRGREAAVPCGPLNLAVTGTPVFENDPFLVEDEDDLQSWGRTAQGLWLARLGAARRIRFAWELAADSGGFHFELPECATHRLWLRLPIDRQPVVDVGVARRVDPAEESNAAAGPPMAPAAGSQWWLIETGRHHKFALRIARQAPEPDLPGDYRQQTVYEVAPGELTVRDQFRFPATGTGPAEIELLVPPGLEVLAIESGGRELPWRSLSPPRRPGSDRGDGEPVGEENETVRVRVRLASATGETEVQVTARGPWSSKEPQLAPKIGVSAGRWREGGAKLIWGAGLTLKDIRLADARAVSLTADRAVDIECFGPQARIVAHVAAANTRLRGTAVHRLTLSETALISQARFHLRAVEGAAYEIQADVPARWVVDDVSVEAAEGSRGEEPAAGPRVGGLLDDWEVLTLPGGRRRLRIDLRRRVGRGQPVLVSVSGHRAAPGGGEALAWADLQLCRPLGVRLDPAVAALDQSPGVRVRFAPVEDWRQAALGDLSPLEAELLEPEPGSLLFRVASVNPRWRLSLDEPDTVVQARLRLEATARPGVLEEQYRLTVTPQAGPLRELLLYFSTKRSERLHWRIVDTAIPFEAEPVSAAEQRSRGLPPEGELWRLTLARPFAQPLVVLAERSSPRGERTRLALPAVVGAASQQGRLALLTEPGVEARLDDDELAPAPGDLADERAIAWGEYRYDPERQLTAGATPVDLVEDARPEQALAWCWLAETEIRCDASGRRRGRTRWLIENRGQRQLQVTLPRAARLLSVAGWTDLEQVALDGGGHRITLPADPPFLACEAEIEWPAGQPPTAGVLRGELPTLDIPVLRDRVTVLLPADVHPRRRENAAEDSLWQRLAGPLRRSDRDAPRTDEAWRQLERRTAGLFGRDRSVRLEEVVARWAAGQPDPLPLWIDSELAAQPSGPEQPSASLAEFLRQRSLRVLIYPDRWILSPRAAADPAASEPVAPGTAVESPPDVVPASAWLSGDRPPAKWRRVTRTEPDLWTPVPAQVEQGTWRVAIDSRRREPIWSAVAAILAAALLWQTTRWAVKWSVLLLTILAAATLLVDPETAPIATWAWLGGWAGLLLAAGTAAPASSTVVPDEPSAGSAAVSPVSGTAMIGLLLVFTAGVVAEETPAGPVRLLPVIIPVDGDQQPVGDFVYLPEELDSLRSAAFREAQESLLVGASYQATLANMGSEPTRSPGVQASFEAVAPPGAREILLPLPRQALVAGEPILVDGQPTEAQWREERLAIPVALSGRYRIETRLRAALTTVAEGGGTRRELRVEIPPLPSAVLEARFPPGANEIDFPTAQGRARERDAAWRVQLGGADQLVARWLEPADVAENLPEIRQLGWLRIAPGAIRLRTRLEFPLSAMRSAWELRFDPRLKPQAPPRDAGFTVRGDPQRPGRLALDWTTEPPRDRAAELVFLLPHGSGVGRVFAPTFEVLETRSRENLLAVSVDPALSSQQNLANLESGALEPFAEAFGEAALGIDWVVPWPAAAEGNWSLDVRPARQDVVCGARLHVVCQPEAVFIDWRGNLRCGESGRHWLRLDCPPMMQIESVQWLRDGQATPIPWTASAAALDLDADVPSAARPQRLLLLPPEPLREEVELRITGRLPPPTGEFALPRILPLEVDRCETRWSVAADGVSVTPRMAEPSAAGEPALERPTRTAVPAAPRDAIPGRPVATGTIVGTEPAEGAPRFSAAPLRGQGRGRLIVRVERRGGVWVAEAAGEVEVVQGELDRIQMEAPAAWANRVVVARADQDAPGVSLEKVPLPQGQQVRLVVRPERPLSGTFRFVLTAPLAQHSAERLVAPRVGLAGLAAAETYLVLPTLLDLQRLAWDTARLAPAAPPPEVDVDLTRNQFFRATDDNYQAAVADVEWLAGAPQVRLADHYAWVDRRQQRSGVTAFDLEPGELRRCDLQLPPRAKLLRVEVDGMVRALEAVEPPAGVPTSAEAVPPPGRRWRFSLAAERLPQRIVAFYQFPPLALSQSGDAAAIESDVPVAGPRLLRPDGAASLLDVERTLWTIAPTNEAESGGSARLASVVRDVTPRRQERIRQQSIAAMIDLSVDVAADGPGGQFTAWYRHWLARLVASSRRWRRLGPATSPWEDPADELLRQQESLAVRFNLSGLYEAVVSGREPESTLGNRWDETKPAAAAVHLALQGNANQTSVVWRSPANDLPRRAIVAALILMGGVALFLIVAGGWLPRIDPRWLIAAAGAAAAFLLAPAWLGWALLVAALASLALSATLGARPATVE